MMSWSVDTRRQEVERLAEAAVHRRAEARLHKQRLSQWSRDTFGRLDTLAWVYAAGVTWGATRDSDHGERRGSGRALRIMNAALVASRFVGGMGAAGAADAAEL